MSDFFLNHPPLICVVARAQFAPLAKIANYIPDLQEAFRLSGYPHFQEQKTKAWHIDDRAEAGMNVAYEEIPRWSFANPEKTISIRVDRESLSLFFGDYHHFAQSRDRYTEILGIVEKSISSLMLVEVQVRYINHIPLQVGENAADWVLPSVLGMPVIGELIRNGSISETGYQTPEGGRLVVRCAALANGLTLPADILPLDIKLRHPLHSPTPFVMLENMHTRIARLGAFTAESCLEQFSELRNHIAEIFQATVTDKARNLWK